MLIQHTSFGGELADIKNTHPYMHLYFNGPWKMLNVAL